MSDIDAARIYGRLVMLEALLENVFYANLFNLPDPVKSATEVAEMIRSSAPPPESNPLALEAEAALDQFFDRLVDKLQKAQEQTRS